jgi:hypothetical protein
MKASSLYSTLVERPAGQTASRSRNALVSLPQRERSRSNRGSKAASFVSYTFSAFPSWRTRHSVSLPMIS